MKTPTNDTHRGVRSRLFLVGSDGKLIARRPEVWSTNWDKCQSCGTTERPHESRGMCHRCFNRWRWQTNHNGYRDKQHALAKKRRMSDEGEARAKAHHAWRLSDPRQRELIRQTKLRWAKRNAKFAPGKRVRWEIIQGHWGQGVIVDNGRGTCEVRSEGTGQVSRMPHKSLELILELD